MGKKAVWGCYFLALEGRVIRGLIVYSHFNENLPVVSIIYSCHITGFPTTGRLCGGNDILTKITKHCIKIGKAVFFWQNSWGHAKLWGDKPGL